MQDRIELRAKIETDSANTNLGKIILAIRE